MRNAGTRAAEIGLEMVAEKSAEIDRLRRALYMSAASCQGGHSGAGRAIADVFGVPFPINMKDLLAKARAEKLDPVELWPWWEKQRLDAGMPSLRDCAVRGGMGT